MFESFEVPKDLVPSDPRFGVGPSLIPNEFIDALKKTGSHLLGTSHRKPAVKNLVKEIQEGIKKFYSLPDGYEVVIGNGGATFLFDMIGLGLVKNKSHHFVCGEFSKKWYLSHSNIPWVNTTITEVEFGRGINISVNEDCDMICCTQSETSTGVMFNELPVVSDDIILAVDATSSAGQLDIEFSKVDLYFFSPQKVMGGEGGLYFAIMSPKALKRAEELYDRNTYAPIVMSWKHAIDNSLKNQTYNTPSITGLFYVNEQLKILNSIGLEDVRKQATKKLELMQEWVGEKKYLSFFVEEQLYRSETVATINVDDKFSVAELAKRLRELKIVYDIEGYRKLGKNQLRISLFHNVKYEDLKKLTEIISLAIEKEM